MLGADYEAVGGDKFGLDADEVEGAAQIALEVLWSAGIISRLNCERGPLNVPIAYLGEGTLVSLS